MNGMITTNEQYDLEEILPRLRAYNTGNVVERVTCSEKSVLKGEGKKDDILADRPDGIMLSNGPGDPKECTQIIQEIWKLYQSDVPIFAICLGHQLMALATGLILIK